MPSGGATRPTSDRVREAVFSALSAWAGAEGPPDAALRGLSFLDLYAGSGAVGLEAMSRGAGPVLLVESHQRAARTAQRNVADLDLPARVVVERVERLVRTRPAEGYDIVFADPPYSLPPQDLDAVLADLVRNGWLAPGGLVVVERATRSQPPAWPTELAEGWARHYGETTVYFGTRQED
jgi:16S rRNA (guanine966-N2)-methyltransferase